MMTTQREVYIAGVRVDNLGTDRLSQLLVEWEQRRVERSEACTAAEVAVVGLRRQITELRQQLYEQEAQLARAKQAVREATGAIKVLNSLYWDSRRGA